MTVSISPENGCYLNKSRLLFTVSTLKMICLLSPVIVTDSSMSRPLPLTTPTPLPSPVIQAPGESSIFKGVCPGQKVTPSLQDFISARSEALTEDEWMIEEHLEPFGSVLI